MHRGCVNNFPISAKIARERSAWSAIDSNSDGALRLGWATDFGSVSANAAESAVAAEQPIDTIKKNERNTIAASPQIRKSSATRANCSAPPKQKYACRPVAVARGRTITDREICLVRVEPGALDAPRPRQADGMLAQYVNRRRDLVVRTLIWKGAVRTQSPDRQCRTRRSLRPLQ
jgi:hypothetical protein